MNQVDRVANVWPHGSWLWVVGLLCWGGAQGAIAQSLPPNIPESIPPASDRLPPLEELLPPSTPADVPLAVPIAPPPAMFPALPDAPRLTINRFEFAGNTAFSAAELTTVVAAYVGRSLTLAEIQAASQAITQHYQDQGYITSGAFVPPQSVQDGVMRVQILEGGVETINVTGVRRLDRGYIRQRVAGAVRSPLNQGDLLNALQRLKRDPLIESIAAELSTGTQPGMNILDLRVVERDAFDLDFSVDNQRSPSVGSDRRQVNFSHGNLTGRGDRFTVGWVNTEGSNSLNNLSYTVPINARNGTLSASYGRSENAIIETPFDALDISSRSHNYQFTYRQPIHQTDSTDFALSLSLSHQTSQTFLGFDDIGPFPLSFGADENGRTTITALRFVQEYSHRSGRDVFALRSQFSLGLDALHSTINIDPIPDSTFATWRLQSQYLRLLAPQTIALLRTDLQLADQGLLAAEQFAIGGASTVRGYRQDFRTADNGFFASAELRVPILRIPQWATLLQLTPFVDYGFVWNSSEFTADNPSTLASFGLGSLLRIGDRFSARLDWGIPLINPNIDQNSLQEQGIHFSVNYRLF
ncbi:ShlB/FhaC/HecB family hemolysin secretion/activation protein [Spirulina major CS-329]|uniref:ShlB/FhaC/HecB family hemolysin secretion/activation protein n=1 Tax=Spirulina TaxID=1154 RepID=UPI00232A980B|nr:MULTISPECIES: ShlB/FhaC/HecB family hemolysin secretion/activation protein [Spirulina]MDB9495480.1 ShlB/FhaC/HecB family hemolysin secretion/activation protein [Spirulina subsalsa CS-330]MDB9503265.1 ShlB/FhaC/HecB family hemolysin secretion/activation protein [Spirulina major CS-329]